MKLKWIGFMLAATVGSATSQLASRPTFDVASVKATSNPGYPTLGAPCIRMISSGRFVTETISLGFLIRLAYKVMEVQISDEPSWANSARFEIDAKAGTNATLAEMRPMIQSLLADRFKLIIHRENREMPVYELVAAKGGLKLSTGKEVVCRSIRGTLPRHCEAKPALVLAGT